MKDEYNIWLCPNGGEFKEQVFRIGHIGNITDCDMQKLKAAFIDLKKRNIIF
jgi:aspartate aminotransferase-like enzyme